MYVCVHAYIYTHVHSYTHTHTHTHTHTKKTHIYIHTYIHTMEYYSAIKGNEIGSFVQTWMDLETVKQSEVSQK